jgi:hypothetical protein
MRSTLSLQTWQILAVVEDVKKTLLVQKGRYINDRLADELARNITMYLCDLIERARAGEQVP